MRNITVTGSTGGGPLLRGIVEKDAGRNEQRKKARNDPTRNTTSSMRACPIRRSRSLPGWPFVVGLVLVIMA